MSHFLIVSVPRQVLLALQQGNWLLSLLVPTMFLGIGLTTFISAVIFIWPHIYIGSNIQLSASQNVYNQSKFLLLSLILHINFHVYVYLLLNFMILIDNEQGSLSCPPIQQNWNVYFLPPRREWLLPRRAY